MLSRRTGWDLGANAFAARLEAVRAAGTPLLDLTETNPARAGFAWPAATLAAALAERDPGGSRPPRRRSPADAARTARGARGRGGVAPGARRRRPARVHPPHRLDERGLRAPAQAPVRAVAVSLLEDGVAVWPGFLFDFARPAHLVVSLLTPEATFAEGARRVAARLVRGTSDQR